MTVFEPVVLFALFLGLKLFTRRRSVRLSDDYQQLVNVIEYLRYSKPESQHGGTQVVEAGQQGKREDHPLQLRALEAPEPPSRSGYSSSSAAAI